MRNLLYIIAFLTFSGQAQTKMSNAEASQLKEKVKALSLTTKTISSDFVQYKHLDFLDNDIETSGKLAFKAPDLVKWEYVSPFKYSVIFKKGKLYINDEGKKSDIDLGANKMFDQLNNLIINSVKGDMFDSSKFNISYFKIGKNSLVHFEIKDQKLGKYIKAFHITFNEKGDVTEVKMIEHSGDYSQIIFSNKVLNKPLDDALFTN